MNEGIDIALVGAKVAASNNQTANLAVHALSASYNIAQIAHYRAMIAGLSNTQLINGVQISCNALTQYRRDLIKHTVLASLDVFTLFMIGFAGRKG